MASTVGSPIGLLLSLTYASGDTPPPPTPSGGRRWIRRRSSGPKWTRVRI